MKKDERKNKILSKKIRSKIKVTMIHGDKDKLVPFQQSLVFDARLKEVGVSSKLFVASGKNHGWRHPVEGELQVFLDWFDDNLLDK